MKSLMRYAIKSGRVTEIRTGLRETVLDPTTGKLRPRGKRRGKSLASQIERNMRESVKSLARLLNCNYAGGDMFLTLKYSDDRLPASKEEAKTEVRRFIRRLDRAYRAQTGRKLRYVLITADKSSKTGEPVRLHHHIVMDQVDYELIAKHWPADQFYCRYLDNTGDYTAIAQYMIKNAGYDRGVRTWSASQGLKKPEYTAAVPVKTLDGIRLPEGAVVVERQVTEDEVSGFRAAYIRYVMPQEGEIGRKSRGRWNGTKADDTTKRRTDNGSKYGASGTAGVQTDRHGNREQMGAG